MLPEIRSSSEHYGEASGTAIGGTPVAGILGDQQAALFGQTVLRAPATRRTPTAPARSCSSTPATEIVRTEKLLTTVGYKLGDGDATYVLEGSIAVTGALIQWLRDRLKIIDSAPEVEELARDGRRQRRRLLRPRLLRPVRPVLARRRARRDRRPDRLRQPRPHRARRAGGGGVADRARSSTPPTTVADVPFTELRVDGGMTANELLMQFQADVLGVPGDPPEGDRDDRARRRLRGRAWRPASGPTRTSCASAGPRTSAGSREHGRGRPRARVRALEEGRPAHARLGRLGLSQPPGRRRRSRSR